MKSKFLLLAVLSSGILTFETYSQPVAVIYDNGSVNNVTCPTFLMIDDDEDYTAYNVPPTGGGSTGTVYFTASTDFCLGVDPGYIAYSGTITIMRNLSVYTTIYIPAYWPFQGMYASQLPYSPGDTWHLGWND